MFIYFMRKEDILSNLVFFIIFNIFFFIIYLGKICWINIILGLFVLKKYYIIGDGFLIKLGNLDIIND